MLNFQRAITAGIIGGVVVDAFLVGARVAHFLGSISSSHRRLSDPSVYVEWYIGLGLVTHFVISIVLRWHTHMQPSVHARSYIRFAGAPSSVLP